MSFLANGVHMEPQVKPRSLRNIATGKITTQSTNKTKRLLKTGFYVEVMPDGDIVEQPDGDIVEQPLKVQANAPAKTTSPLFWVLMAGGSIAAVAAGIVLIIR